MGFTVLGLPVPRALSQVYEEKPEVAVKVAASPESTLSSLAVQEASVSVIDTEGVALTTTVVVEEAEQPLAEEAITV